MLDETGLHRGFNDDSRLCQSRFGVTAFDMAGNQHVVGMGSMHRSAVGHLGLPRNREIRQIQMIRSICFANYQRDAFAAKPNMAFGQDRLILTVGNNPKTIGSLDIGSRANRHD